MANLPHDPIDTPAELEISAVSTNADVGGISALYPPLERISLEDLVGPEAANRQHAALEKRTLVLLDRLNKVVDLVNALDVTYLRRSAVAAKDGAVGIQTDMPCNDKTLTGLRDAIDPSEPVTLRQLPALLPVTRVPTGAVMAFPKTIPAGWLACDNALYTSSSLPAGYTWEQLLDLRIYLGTALGDPAGSVRMPDYRGRVIIGAGQGASLTARNAGEMGGSEQHVLIVDEMPAHSHTIPLAGTGVWGDGQNYRPGGTQTSGHLGSQGGGQPHNNMQPFAVANVAIKV